MTTDQRNAALEILALVTGPLALVALAASAIWSVDAMAEGAPLRLFGVTPSACPGCVLCGMSRAFTAASHGELASALEFNPLVAVAYPGAWLLALAAPFAALRLVRRRRAAARS